MRRKTINELADMICGNDDVPDSVSNFPYRSSTYLSEFFADCELDQYVHDGSTRKWWVASVLDEIAKTPSPDPALPSMEFQTIVKVLMDKADAMDHDPDRNLALTELNNSLAREGLGAFYADDNCCYVRNTRTGAEGQPDPVVNRGLTREEIERQARLENYLEQASEDDLIENVLLPLFQTLRFHRVSVAGHKDKALEYGKDVWMKFLLPTGHWLYFGLQAKRGKLDAAGRSKNTNVAEIHSQTVMMLGHEIFDPDINKRTLVDHAIIASGGEITKQARNWLGERLNASQRSQILFMDRTDIVRLFIIHNIPLPAEESWEEIDAEFDDDIPF